MKHKSLSLSLLALVCASQALATTVLYDNTTTDTQDALFFSIGPYTGLGDQIQLVSAGNAGSAFLQMFNVGGPGTFDATLQFYQVGAPVGTQIGPTFSLTGVTSVGLDNIDLAFVIGSQALPQDVIFIVRVSNASAGMDLGVNLFEPPTVGSSDNTFLIVDNGTFSQAGSLNENVHFRLLSDRSADAGTPEPSTLGLLGVGLLAAWVRRGRR